MVSLVRVALLLAAASLTILGAVHGGTPWDLRNYDRICKKTRLSGIRSEASGLTYSPVTNTIWVVTLKPMGVFEYDIDGDLLRRVTNLDGFRFKDPEGMTPRICTLSHAASSWRRPFEENALHEPCMPDSSPPFPRCLHPVAVLSAAVAGPLFHTDVSPLRMCCSLQRTVTVLCSSCRTSDANGSAARWLPFATRRALVADT